VPDGVSNLDEHLSLRRTGSVADWSDDYHTTGFANRQADHDAIDIPPGCELIAIPIRIELPIIPDGLAVIKELLVLLLKWRSASATNRGLVYSSRLTYHNCSSARRTAMRLHCALLVLGCAVLGGTTSAAESFPYTGHVQQDNTRVRSGPGRQYYTTSHLSSGDRVEVYRDDPGGWCAIRPPEGSFSWIPGRLLRATDTTGVYEVTANGVIAYVGSQLREIRDVVQVRLNRGEPVQVVGSQPVATTPGGPFEMWLKIAPPAGEFRWVAAEDIRREAPEEPADERLARDEPPSSEPTVAIKEVEASTVKADASVAKADIGEAKTDVDRKQPKTVRWTPLLPGTLQRRASQTVSQEKRTGARTVPGKVVTASYKEDESPAPKRVGEAGTIKLVPLEPQDRPSTAKTVKRSDPVERVQGGGEVNKRLQDIDLEFSLMAARPPESRQFDTLLSRAQAIADNAPTPLDRRRAGLLVEKIREFENLQKHRRTGTRHLATAPVGSDLAAPPGESDEWSPANRAAEPRPRDSGPRGVLSQLTDRLPFPIGPGAPPTKRVEPNFDGTGYLMPVVHRRNSLAGRGNYIPPFVLTDRNGTVLAYVTPAPGLNLRRYARQQIGIFGQQQPLAHLNKPHLTAGRVVVLSRHR